jgi:hypothetical protein
MPSLSNRLINWGMAKPRLVNGIHIFVDFIPPLRSAIERRVSGVMEENNIANEAGSSTRFTTEDRTGTPLEATFTPFGNSIYAQLKSGIEINKKGSL